MLLYRGEQRFDLKLAPAKLPLILQGQGQLIVQASAKAKPSNWRYAGDLRQMIAVPFVGKTIVRNFPINFDERIFKELIGFAITFAGMAFGFGKQSANISTLRRDTDAIGNMHRETLQELGQIKAQLARIDQRLLFLERE